MKLEPGVVELTMAICRFEHSILDFHGDAFDKIVSEVLRVRGENTSNNCPSILSTRAPLTTAKSDSLSSQAGYDRLVLPKAS